MIHVIPPHDVILFSFVSSRLPIIIMSVSRHTACFYEESTLIEHENKMDNAIDLTNQESDGSILQDWHPFTFFDNIGDVPVEELLKTLDKL